MIDNWMITEMLVEQRAADRRKQLAEAQRLRVLETPQRRPGLRRRLARALVGLGLRLDAEATRSALVTSTSSR
jgi:hypothetical protein